MGSATNKFQGCRTLFHPKSWKLKKNDFNWFLIKNSMEMDVVMKMELKLIELEIYRRHLMAVIMRTAPSMADTSATTTNIGIHVFSVLGSANHPMTSINHQNNQLIWLITRIIDNCNNKSLQWLITSNNY